VTAFFGMNWELDRPDAWAILQQLENIGIRGPESQVYHLLVPI